MWIWKTRTNWSRLNFRVISLKINFRLKGESPNSHQLKGWFLIRGKEIVCVKEKQKPLGDNRYDNFTPREGRGGTLRLGQGRYHRQLFPSGDTSFLLQCCMHLSIAYMHLKAITQSQSTDHRKTAIIFLNSMILKFQRQTQLRQKGTSPLSIEINQDIQTWPL